MKAHRWLLPALIAALGALGFRAWLLRAQPTGAPELALCVRYPGALPEEVRNQVTVPLERELSRMPGLRTVRSRSGFGRADLVLSFDGRRALRNGREELRRRLEDLDGQLPPTASAPEIDDDYGAEPDWVLAVSGAGYSVPELYECAKQLEARLLSEDGVVSCRIFGNQPEAIYLEFHREQLARLGISPQTVFQTVAERLKPVPAGFAELGSEYLPLRIDWGRRTALEELGATVLTPGGGRVLRVGDVAEFRRGLREPVENFFFCENQPAVGLALVTTPRGAEQLSQRLAAWRRELPAGVQVAVVREPETQTPDSAALILLVVAWVLLLPDFCGLRPGAGLRLIGGLPALAALAATAALATPPSAAAPVVLAGVLAAGWLVAALRRTPPPPRSGVPTRRLLIGLWRYYPAVLLLTVLLGALALVAAWALPTRAGTGRPEPGELRLQLRFPYALRDTACAELSRELAERLSRRPEVVGTRLYVGIPAPRRAGEAWRLPEPGLVELEVVVTDPAAARTLRRELEGNWRLLLPEAQLIAERPRPWFRVTGTEPEALRLAGDRLLGQLGRAGAFREMWSDWRNPVKVVIPEGAAERVARAGIAETAVAETLLAGFEGVELGRFREGDEPIPVLARPAPEGEGLDRLRSLPVWSPAAGRTLPLGQLLDGFRTRWLDPVLFARDRELTLTLYGSAVEPGRTSAPAMSPPELELPPGVTVEPEVPAADPAHWLRWVPGALLLLLLLLLRPSRWLPVVMAVPAALAAGVLGLGATGAPLDATGWLLLAALVGFGGKMALYLLAEYDRRPARPRAIFAVSARLARTVLRPALGGIVATLLWWGCDPRPALALALGLALLTLYLLVIYPLSCSALRSR